MYSPTDHCYRVYYCLPLANGGTSVALLTTEDFKVFRDHGTVFELPRQMRGTGGMESSCVVFREGLWHLFVGSGIDVWHSINNRPDNFRGGPRFGKETAGGPDHTERPEFAKDREWPYALLPWEKQRVIICLLKES
jgi:hypothetical protein